MKKKVFIGVAVIMMLVAVTGCGMNKVTKISSSTVKTMVCTHEEMEDGVREYDKVEIKYSDDKILNVKATSISDVGTDKDIKDFTLAFGNLLAEKLNEVDGVYVEFSEEGDSSIKSVTSIDYEKLDVNQVKKALGDLYDEDDDDLYSGKNMTIREFIDENYDDYSCE